MLIYLETQTEISKIVTLSDQGEELGRIEAMMKNRQTDELLIELNKLIQGDKNRIRGIFINTNSGSHTSVRICLTVANVLGWALNIQPVNVNSVEEISHYEPEEFHRPILPIYEGKPFITKEKDGLAL